MRLGISHVLSHETPEQWAQDLRALGLSAAVFPVEYAAGDAQIAAYADAPAAKKTALRSNARQMWHASFYDKANHTRFASELEKL